MTPKIRGIQARDAMDNGAVQRTPRNGLAAKRMDRRVEEGPPPLLPPAPESREQGTKVHAAIPPLARVPKKQRADEEPLARQLLPETEPELLPHAEVPPQAAAPDFWSCTIVDPKRDRYVDKLTSCFNDFALKMHEDTQQWKAALEQESAERTADFDALRTQRRRASRAWEESSPPYLYVYRCDTFDRFYFERKSAEDAKCDGRVRLRRHRRPSAPRRDSRPRWCRKG